MRVPAVVAWVAIAPLALSTAASPARGVTLAWLTYEGLLGEQLAVPIPVTETIVDGILIGTVTNWVWQCTVTCADDGFQIEDLDLTLDSDPVITFGASAFDFGAPSTFGFIFSQSIVPTLAPGTATSSFSGSTTNGGGVPGVVSVTPAAPPVGISVDGDAVSEMMVYSLSQNGGLSWTNVGIDLGPAFSSNGALISDTYGPFNSPTVAGPAGAGNYDAMRVDVNFTLSGGSDRFTFNGDATILEEGFIPEPATAAQLALGLLGLGWMGRRQRS